MAQVWVASPTTGHSSTRHVSLYASQQTEHQHQFSVCEDPRQDGTSTEFHSSTCTSHRQNWRRMRNGGWPRRYDSVQRQMQARVPRVLCVRAMMGTCASNLWRRTLSTRFAASTEEPGPDRTAQSSAPCAGSLSEQGHADLERHVPELYDWVRNKNEAAPTMRCAILDVVWFPGVLQQLWIDVSVRCPHAERYNESASKPGVAAERGEKEKTRRCGSAVRSLLCEACGRLGGEGTRLLRDFVATAAANGRCSPHAVGRWRTQLERVLLSAQADTYLRALGSRVAERPAAEPLLLFAE